MAPRMSAGFRRDLDRPGAPLPEVCRELEVSQPSFYRWKQKCAGLGVPEARRVQVFEDRKFKQLVAYLSLDRLMLLDFLRKKA